MHITSATVAFFLQSSLGSRYLSYGNDQSLNTEHYYSAAAFSLLSILSPCLRSFRRIHNAHALNTTTVRSTDTIQYNANPPMGRLRVSQPIIGMEKIVCSRQFCSKQKESGESQPTAMNVPGKNTVVRSASAFIAAPSFIPAAAMSRPEMASRVVMKLYTCDSNLSDYP